MDDVPSEVELCAQAKNDVGKDVGIFVDVVHGGGLSACQLQHQPQMQGDAVDLHKESDDSAGYVQLSVETVQETPDHLRRTQTGKLILHPTVGLLCSVLIYNILVFLSCFGLSPLRHTVIRQQRPQAEIPLNSCIIVIVWYRI